jgi:hypothetical protein
MAPLLEASLGVVDGAIAGMCILYGSSLSGGALEHVTT